MVWPPSTHQDVADEITSLRARVTALEGGEVAPPAATGPPAVSTTGLMADFVADDAVGSTVTSWPNRVAGQPGFTITGNPQKSTADASGKPSVIFDGVDDYASAAIGTFPIPATRIFIGRLVTATAGVTYLGTTNPTTNRSILSSHPTTGKWNMYGGTGANFQHPLSYDTAKHLVAGVFNGTSALQVIDGTAATGNSGSEAGEGLRVGANQQATIFANVEVFRVLVYNRGLTAAEIAEIRAAHQAYYGLP